MGIRVECFNGERITVVIERVGTIPKADRKHVTIAEEQAKERIRRSLLPPSVEEQCEIERNEAERARKEAE